MAGQQEWTVTLECVASGRRVTLPDLASLIAYLNRPVDDAGAPSSGDTFPPARSAPRQEDPRCPSTAH